MTVQLATLPEARNPVVVVGTSVRKPLAVLTQYLASLDWQEHPDRVQFHYCFVPDFTKDQADADAYLREWVKHRGGELLRGLPSAAGDFADTGVPSHQWQFAAMQRVGRNKNLILQRAVQLKADAIWLADADLIMDRTTFASLWSVEKPIACAVYWTHWNREQRETVRPHAGPQVWLRHPYQLDGRGMDQFEFRRKLVRREVTRVWGQGACSLIRRPVVEAGVTFEHLNDPALLQGLMGGEDRHFCLRAERLHMEMVADPWPDIFHIYHLPEDVQDVPAMVQRLGSVHPLRASLGDLVSLRLDALEPMPQPDGKFFRIAPQYVRGRIGTVPLLPEIEDAVFAMDRGTNRILPVHFPAHFPIPYLRGRRRLIRVELLDCKPNGFPPVLDREMRPIDLAADTEQQRAALA